MVCYSKGLTVLSIDLSKTHKVLLRKQATRSREGPRSDKDRRSGGHYSQIVVPMHAVGGSAANVDLDSLINEVLLVAPSPDFEKLETVSFEAKYEYSDLAKSDSHAIPAEAIYEPVLERVDGHIYADLTDAKPTTSTAIGCDYRAPGTNLARALSDLQVTLCGLPSLRIIPRPPQDLV